MEATGEISTSLSGLFTISISSLQSQSRISKLELFLHKNSVTNERDDEEFSGDGND